MRNNVGSALTIFLFSPFRLPDKRYRLPCLASLVEQQQQQQPPPTRRGDRCGVEGETQADEHCCFQPGFSQSNAEYCSLQHRYTDHLSFTQLLNYSQSASVTHKIFFSHHFVWTRYVCCEDDVST